MTTPRCAPTPSMARSRISGKRSANVPLPASSWPARMSAWICVLPRVPPGRSTMVWLDSAPSRLVMMVAVLGAQRDVVDQRTVLAAEILHGPVVAVALEDQVLAG